MTIILASTSPRRIELLRSLGIEFRAVAPDADETPRRGEAPLALVRRLARAKAQSVARKEALVIAADTIVVSPDGRRILGKPKSAAEARRMLGLLAGRTHTVYTAYCVLFKGSARVRAVRSRVTMRKLGAAAIRAYVATGEPMDKAGSYAAQGIGAALIERISGSYTNVVGLPMAQLLVDLEKEFGMEPFRWRL